MFDNDLFNKNVLGGEKKIEFLPSGEPCLQVCVCVCVSVSVRVCVLGRYIRSFRLNQYLSPFAK